MSNVMKIVWNDMENMQNMKKIVWKDMEKPR